MVKRRSSPADRLVGKRVRMLRVERHMSQQKLAAVIGVTFQQVQKYESGANRISIGHLLLVAQAFNLTLDSILSGLEEPGANKHTDQPQFAMSMSEARLLKSYRASSSEQRQLILHLAEQFAKVQWVYRAKASEGL